MPTKPRAICWSWTRPYESIVRIVGSAGDIFGLEWFESYSACINRKKWSSPCFQCGYHDLVLGVYVGDPIRDHIGCVYFPPFHNRIQVSTILDGALQRNVDIFSRWCGTVVVCKSLWLTNRDWNCNEENTQNFRQAMLASISIRYYISYFKKYFLLMTGQKKINSKIPC